jgi:hypothetical protein
MATQFAPARVPHPAAATPFLLARPLTGDMGWNDRSALLAATAAERAHDTRRNTRGRIAYLLCEFGFQLSRHGTDKSGELPLTRTDLADALGVSLCRVKRTLALLSLSQVVECTGSGIRVLDWRRLCSVGCYQLGRLGLHQEEEDFAPAAAASEEPQLLTRAGDQACFV